MRELMESDLDDVFFDEEAEEILFNGQATKAIPEIGTGNTRQVDDQVQYELARFTLKTAEIFRVTGRSEFYSGDVVLYKDKEWRFKTLLQSDHLVARGLWTANEGAVRLR